MIYFQINLSIIEGNMVCGLSAQRKVLSFWLLLYVRIVLMTLDKIPCTIFVQKHERIHGIQNECSCLKKFFYTSLTLQKKTGRIPIRGSFLKLWQSKKN